MTRTMPLVLFALALCPGAAGAADPRTVTVDGGRYPAALQARYDVTCGVDRIRITLSSHHGQPSRIRVGDDRGRPVAVPDEAVRFLAGTGVPVITGMVCNPRTLDVAIAGVSMRGGDTMFRFGLPLPAR